MKIKNMIKLAAAAYVLYALYKKQQAIALTGGASSNAAISNMI